MFRIMCRNYQKKKTMSKNVQSEKYKSPAYWTQLIQLSLYEMIQDYLSREGVTKKEFAERLGVSKGYVSQILNGDFDHRLSKLVQLGLACGRIPKFEFMPISESSETLRNTYLSPKTWQKTGSYSGITKIERINPFRDQNPYLQSQRYTGERIDWENGNNNTKTA